MFNLETQPVFARSLLAKHAGVFVLSFLVCSLVWAVDYNLFKAQGVCSTHLDHADQCECSSKQHLFAGLRLLPRTCYQPFIVSMLLYSVSGGFISVDMTTWWVVLNSVLFVFQLAMRGVMGLTYSLGLAFFAQLSLYALLGFLGNRRKQTSYSKGTTANLLDNDRWKYISASALFLDDSQAQVHVMPTIVSEGSESTHDDKQLEACGDDESRGDITKVTPYSDVDVDVDVDVDDDETEEEDVVEATDKDGSNILVAVMPCVAAQVVFLVFIASLRIFFHKSFSLGLTVFPFVVAFIEWAAVHTLSFVCERARWSVVECSIFARLIIVIFESVRSGAVLLARQRASTAVMMWNLAANVILESLSRGGVVTVVWNLVVLRRDRIKLSNYRIAYLNCKVETEYIPLLTLLLMRIMEWHPSDALTDCRGVLIEPLRPPYLIILLLFGTEILSDTLSMAIRWGLACASPRFHVPTMVAVPGLIPAFFMWGWLFYASSLSFQATV